MYMRVGDYCQKLELPYFVAEQPGDTYYMSPLTINCYGLVDVTGKVETSEEGVQSYKHLLHAYIYDEGVAGCGGDNVTSLILKNLHDGGLLDPTKGPGGKLVVGVDNCPSQNKKQPPPSDSMCVAR